MEALGFLALVVPIVLAYVLRGTAWWWLASVLPWIGAAILVTMVDHDHPGDVGGIGAFGNGILYLGAIGLASYGAILLAMAYVARRWKQTQDRRLGRGD